MKQAFLIDDALQVWYESIALLVYCVDAVYCVVGYESIVWDTPLLLRML